MASFSGLYYSITYLHDYQCQPASLMNTQLLFLLVFFLMLLKCHRYTRIHINIVAIVDNTLLRTSRTLYIFVSIRSQPTAHFSTTIVIGNRLQQLTLPICTKTLILLYHPTWNTFVRLQDKYLLKNPSLRSLKSYS